MKETIDSLGDEGIAAAVEDSFQCRVVIDCTFREEVYIALPSQRRMGRVGFDQSCGMFRVEWRDALLLSYNTRRIGLMLLSIFNCSFIRFVPGCSVILSKML